MNQQFLSLIYWHDIGNYVRQELSYIANIMIADVLATKRAKASATIILAILNRINSMPAR